MRTDIVTGEAVTSWMAKDAFIAAQEPKELFWVQGAMHNDFYDRDQYATPAVAKLNAFFDAKLK
jgi:uncharacterized protein